jgi:uncharacterized protein YyaL (SSP411 family)
VTTSWSVLGEPGPAIAIADDTIDALRGESGAFRDGSDGDGPGLLSRPLYPLDTNVELAEALLDLRLLTGEERYSDAARESLAAFADAAERMGVEVAGFATAASRIQNPTAIRLGTPAGADLHRAALRLADHESVVVPDDDGTAAGVARLVVDGDERGTADTPAELEDLLTNSTA